MRKSDARLTRLTPEQEYQIRNTNAESLTQDRRVLAFLLCGGALTPMVAWQRLGVYRLSSAVHKIRKAGYSVIDEGAEVHNRFGETCSVASYRLERSCQKSKL